MAVQNSATERLDYDLASNLSVTGPRIAEYVLLILASLVMNQCTERHIRTFPYAALPGSRLLQILSPFSKASLPYVDALIQEVLRWNTTTFCCLTPTCPR